MIKMSYPHVLLVSAVCLMEIDTILPASEKTAAVLSSSISGERFPTKILNLLTLPDRFLRFL